VHGTGKFAYGRRQRQEHKIRKYETIRDAYSQGMSREFSDILRGLMENRGLAPGPVSYASARARSTITQLLNGRIEPTAQLLADIAPDMQMPLADLLVIAGIPTGPAPDLRPRISAALEIGDLVAAASSLRPEQVAELVEMADRLKAGNTG
jgi:transcriptional regulator with XRE-family HTH domain